MASNEDLRNHYRATWKVFSRRLDLYHACVDAGDREGAETALAEVEKARAAYDAARDRLAQSLGSENLSSINVDSRRLRVRNTAHLIWEMAGRPEGTAEADWRRAEQLVRSAAG
jgi:hypothetical protein